MEQHSHNTSPGQELGRFSDSRRSKRIPVLAGYKDFKITSGWLQYTQHIRIPQTHSEMCGEHAAVDYESAGELPKTVHPRVHAGSDLDPQPMKLASSFKQLLDGTFGVNRSHHTGWESPEISSDWSVRLQRNWFGRGNSRHRRILKT